MKSLTWSKNSSRANPRVEVEVAVFSVEITGPEVTEAEAE